MTLTTSPTRNLVLLLGGLVISGCADGHRDDLEALEQRGGNYISGGDIEARERSPGGGGVWINNGLSTPLVGGVDPAFALSTPQGLSQTEGVLVDPGTRVAAEYLVECALPDGASITKTVDGEQIELEGRLGLAPQWELGDCDEDCQQWVSACMLARTNITAQTVKISLRAEHPAIGMDGNHRFPLYEGSFFGNIFADPDAQYVCQGDQGDHLTQRACAADPASCGFVDYGDCELTSRCNFVQVDVDEVIAVDCLADGDPDPFHTITVYIQEDWLDDIEDESQDD